MIFCYVLFLHFCLENKTKKFPKGRATLHLIKTVWFKFNFRLLCIHNSNCRCNFDQVTVFMVTKTWIFHLIFPLSIISFISPLSFQMSKIDVIFPFIGAKYHFWLFLLIPKNNSQCIITNIVLNLWIILAACYTYIIEITLISRLFL